MLRVIHFRDTVSVPFSLSIHNESKHSSSTQDVNGAVVRSSNDVHILLRIGYQLICSRSPLPISIRAQVLAIHMFNATTQDSDLRTAEQDDGTRPVVRLHNADPTSPDGGGFG